MLTVSAEALEYIRKVLLRGAEEEMAVAFALELLQDEREEVVGLGEDISIEALIQQGRKYFANLPSIVRLRWSVVTAQAHRFPEHDLHEISGLMFYLPEDTMDAIGTRELVLDGGVLRFQPDLQPFEFKRSGFL